MTCVKTGCHIWIEPYREFAYGDAFRFEPIREEDAKIWRIIQQQGFINLIRDTFYFRLAGTSFTPINGREQVDGVVLDYDNWFKDKPYSTLITNQVVWETLPTSKFYKEPSA